MAANLAVHDCKIGIARAHRHLKVKSTVYTMESAPNEKSQFLLISLKNEILMNVLSHGVSLGVVDLALQP